MISWYESHIKHWHKEWRRSHFFDLDTQLTTDSANSANQFISKRKPCTAANRFLFSPSVNGEWLRNLSRSPWQKWRSTCHLVDGSICSFSDQPSSVQGHNSPPWNQHSWNSKWTSGRHGWIGWPGRCRKHGKPGPGRGWSTGWSRGATSTWQRCECFTNKRGMWWGVSFEVNRSIQLWISPQRRPMLTRVLVSGKRPQLKIHDIGMMTGWPFGVSGQLKASEIPQTGSLGNSFQSMSSSLVSHYWETFNLPDAHGILGKSWTSEELDCCWPTHFFHRWKTSLKEHPSIYSTAQHHNHSNLGCQCRSSASKTDSVACMASKLMPSSTLGTAGLYNMASVSRVKGIQHWIFCLQILTPGPKVIPRRRDQSFQQNNLGTTARGTHVLTLFVTTEFQICLRNNYCWCFRNPASTSWLFVNVCKCPIIYRGFIPPTRW